MTEATRTRVLAWEGCVNVRDLGGLPTAGGGETRWESVVRSDNPGLLTDLGQAALVQHGIRTIVDLRLPSEVEEYPNPFAVPGAHGVTYHNISFIDPNAPPPPEYPTLADDYKGMLDRFRPAVVAVMRAIAEADGGVLVHCAAGKDRTGLIAAMLEELAGVPRDVIGADYALTEELMAKRTREWLEHGPGEREERERNIMFYRPTSEVILAALRHLDEQYGGVEGYLLGGGLTPEEIAKLRARLVG